MTIEHKTIGAGDRHAVANWVIVSGGLPALGSLSVTEEDVGKQAWVVGVGHYALATAAPAVWESVGITISSAAFDSGTRVLTLSLSDGTTRTVTIPIDTDDTAVGALISTALVPYYTAAQVDTQIALADVAGTFRYTAKSGRLDAMSFYAAMVARQTLGGLLTPFTHSATGGLTVAIASTGNSRIYSMSTPLYAEYGKLELHLTAVCGTIVSGRTPSFGLAFGAAGTGCRHYLWRSDGLFSVATDAEVFTTLLAASASTAFVAADTLKMVIAFTTSTGNATLLAYKNSVLVATIALSSVPTGLVSFSFRGEGTFTLPTLYSDGMSQSALDAIAVAATPELSSAERTRLTVLERMLENLELSPPSNWTGQSLPVKVYEVSAGKFITNYDSATSLPFAESAATYVHYVDVATGSDSNSGTSIAPYKTLHKAVHGLSGNVLVYVKAGVYDKDNSFKDANPTCTNLIIRRWGSSGRIVSSMHHSDQVWTVVPSYSNTYSSTVVTCGAVLDSAELTAYGNYTVLQRLSSIADVNATAGSYYVDGTTVYVHTVGSRPADSSVLCMEDKRNFRFNVAGGTVWAEYIDFQGGTRAAQVSHTGNAASWARAYLHECTTKYSANTRNGFSTDGAVQSILYRCAADNNEKDGFNYHSYLTSAPPLAVEIECTGYYNGHDGDTINNCSTMHDGGTVLRVACRYIGAEGRVVHDINSSHSWNVGCHNDDSYAAVASPVANVNWAAGFATGDATKMYLYKCSGANSTNGLQTLASSTIYELDYDDLAPDVAGSNVLAYPT